jgi:hypothetical protein
MRQHLFIAAAAALLVSSTNARAQTATGNAHTSTSDFHIGIGAGMSLLTPVIVGSATLFAGPFGGGSIVLPLDIAGVVRIEPEFSIFHYNESDDTSSNSVTAIKTGVGLFWMFGVAPDAQGYLGARLGPQFVSSKQVNEEVDIMTGEVTEVKISRSAVNFAVGPSVGGEYFPSEHFSIGAEAQVNFIHLGEEDVEIDPGSDPTSSDETGFVAHTNAIIFARVFFL